MNAHILKTVGTFSKQNEMPDLQEKLQLLDFALRPHVGHVGVCKMGFHAGISQQGYPSVEEASMSQTSGSL